MITDGPITFTGLIKFLQYIKGSDHWHYVGATGEPAFENSWVNYGITTQVARFMKDAVGVVHIEGLVKDGTIGDVPVFTLPSNYRPGLELTWASMGNNAIGRLVVQADGNVEAMTGNNAWFSLNCSFYLG